MIESAAIESHPMQEDLLALRADALRGLVGAMLAAAFGVLATGMIDIAFVESRIIVVSGSLALLALLVYRIQVHTFTGAAGLLLAGLLFDTAFAAHVYSVHQALYALPLVVFVTPLLLTFRWVVVTALGANLVVVAFATYGTVPLTRADLVALSVLPPATAGIAWIAYRPMRTMLNWAWASYLEERRKTTEVRLRQAELAQVTKSLAEACDRLEFANRALAHARRAAEEARRMKDDFATAISHELRTPLNLIIGFSEMLVESASSAEAARSPHVLRGDVETIYRNACHLSALIDDVLDLGRLDAQRLALQKEWLRLADVVEQAVNAVEALYAKAGLSITVDLAPDLPPLYVDRTRIRQVLINLLTNAVRYTEVGGVRITAHRQDGDVAVSVADTGVGIPPEELPYVFERFRQTGPLGRRGGFGLGLTVSKQLVELHAGTMWVTSEPNQGSTFTFTLPVIDNVTAVVVNPKLELLGTSHSGERTRRSILILGDETEAARVFQRYLDEDRVQVAASPAEVSRIARAGPVHAAIVANAATPLADDLVRRLLRHHPQVPVFRCNLRTVARAKRDLGTAAFLTKPITREQLEQTIRQLKVRPHRVLVVDDDAEMVQLLRRMLHAIVPRCRIHTATTVEDGLALGERERPDLVLLDLLMPGLDGYAFLGTWQTRPSTEGVPVVVISAASDEDHQLITAESMEIRRDGGLNLVELMRIVRGALDCMLPSAGGDFLSSDPYSTTSSPPDPEPGGDGDLSSIASGADGVADRGRRWQTLKDTHDDM